jgi:hypothetical protein
MACYKLEEYETALEAFEKGAELTDAQKNPQFSIWAQKCRIALAGEQEIEKPSQQQQQQQVPADCRSPACCCIQVDC